MTDKNVLFVGFLILALLTSLFADEVAKPTRLVGPLVFFGLCATAYGLAWAIKAGRGD